MQKIEIVLLCNFIIPSGLIKFLTRDEVYMKTRCQFFESLIQNQLPQVFAYFKNLDISFRLFFYDWIEYLFTKTFKYEILLRIWDNYLIRGDIFIYEVALSIIKLQDKELINSPVKSILTNLSIFPEKYTEDDLFDVIGSLNVIYLLL